MKTRRNTLLLAAALWVSLFLTDMLVPQKTAGQLLMPDTGIVTEAVPEETGSAVTGIRGLVVHSRESGDSLSIPPETEAAIVELICQTLTAELQEQPQ